MHASQPLLSHHSPFRAVAALPGWESILKCCDCEQNVHVTEPKENPTHSRHGHKVQQHTVKAHRSRLLIQQGREAGASLLHLLPELDFQVSSSRRSSSPTTLLSKLSQPFQGGRDFHTL